MLVRNGYLFLFSNFCNKLDYFSTFGFLLQQVKLLFHFVLQPLVFLNNLKLELFKTLKMFIIIGFRFDFFKISVTLLKSQRLFLMNFILEI
jgi:hypothetical protein